MVSRYLELYLPMELPDDLKNSQENLKRTNCVIMKGHFYSLVLLVDRHVYLVWSSLGST